MINSEFSASLLQSSVSRESSEIIIILLVYGAVYFQFLKITTRQQCTWTHFFFRPARPWAHKSAQMHLLFKQRGAGRENENCVGLKLAKTLAPHCAGCMIEPVVFTVTFDQFNASLLNKGTNYLKQIFWP